MALLDAGLPGTLPVLNSHCVKQGIKTALALGCRVNQRSTFERKHYFYCDMPVGYQITQQEAPLASQGEVRLLGEEESEERVVRITRIQLEQDSGKSIHDVDPRLSLVDLNRAGVGLMEIVSEPDMSTPAEATAFVRKVQALVRHIGTCNGNMEEGSLRCDVNVSVELPGGIQGARCEVKNLNSLRSVHRAIEYEAPAAPALLAAAGCSSHWQVARHTTELTAGREVVMETRMFDAAANLTRRLRSKEQQAPNAPTLSHSCPAGC